jgi:hypothetical protein
MGTQGRLLCNRERARELICDRSLGLGTIDVLFEQLTNG